MFFVHDKDFNLKNKNLSPKPAFETYESPDRVKSIWTYLESMNIIENHGIRVFSPKEIVEKDLLRVHSPFLIDSVKNLTDYGGGEIGRWVKATRDTFPLAMKSAGSVVKLCELISGVSKDEQQEDSNEFKAGFSINRPPGHHAGRDTTEGLCVFNNIAIAIQYLREVYHFHDRIAIIDIDAHFGNGTSSLFYEDPNVLHFSVHESTFMGSRGMSREIGAGKGAGTNINYRVPLGALDEMWLRFLNIYEQIIRQFKPTFIIIAAGLDGHWSDPMGNLCLTSNAYKRFGEWISKLSSDICEGRIGFVLEGGYSLLMLGRLVISLISPFFSKDFIAGPPIDLLFPHQLFPNKEKQMLRQLSGQEQALKTLLEPYWSIKI